MCFRHIQAGDSVEFISEPSTQMISRDRRGIFRCLASPSGVRIEWLQNGHPVREDSAGIIRLSGNKLTVRLRNNSHESFLPKSTEHINLQVAKGRHYLQCLARHRGQAIISQRSQVMLAEMFPFPNQPDVHLTVMRGNTAAIICKPPESIPRAITEFFFNDEKIHIRSDKYVHLPSGNLQIINAQASDAGVYHCSAHNPFLDERKMAKHKVHLKVVDGVEDRAVRLSSVPGPGQVSAAMGMNLTFECLAEGFPVPIVVWHRKGGHRLPHGHQQIAGNLQLFMVRRSDEGVYVCQAHNRLGKVSAEVELKVLEFPHILRPPERHQASEGQSVTFSCGSEGKPPPDIVWYHNGEKISHNSHFSWNESYMNLKHIKRHHQGIYQCFASNEVGSVHASGLLTVFSDQPLAANSTRLGKDYYGDLNEDEDDLEDVPHKGKHKGGVKLVPPSRPEVTRLSEDSVMVRWTVPPNNGLPINFFKVQFQEFQNNKNCGWNTIDEDIPLHVTSYHVVQLKPGAKYKFRISAVYSNNDNRQGPNSAKFTLTKNPLLKRPQFAPVILEAKALSPDAIEINWQFAERETPIQGFLVWYRTTDSAGEYTMSPVVGANTQSHIISHLLPRTSYDIKMQSFNAAGSSDFSNIYTCKTQGSDTLDPNRQVAEEEEEERPYNPSDTDERDTTNRYITLSIVLGVLGLLVLVLALWVLVKKCQRSHMAARGGPGTVLNPNLPSKNKVNGFPQNGFLDTSKINIQVNPLSDGDPTKTTNKNTIEGPYSLMEYQEEPFNNNNEVIFLGSLQRNCKDTTGI